MHSTYGLVGYPLGHSFSRAFFSEKFEREGVDAEYLNLEIENIASLPTLLSQLPDLKGFNVTIPYKQAIIGYLDELSPEAAAIGAVNVVKVENRVTGRHLKGYNSDVVGFVEALRPELASSARARALVLGSGGASRAVVAGLNSLGMTPVVVSRTPGPGQLSYTDLTAEVMSSHTVIINTTPVGMYPKVDACPDIPYELLTPAHVCMDLIYNPATTLFMKRAAAHGATTLNGLKMLHGQALEAWRIWTSPTANQ